MAMLAEVAVGVRATKWLCAACDGDGVGVGVKIIGVRWWGGGGELRAVTP